MMKKLNVLIAAMSLAIASSSALAQEDMKKGHMMGKTHMQHSKMSSMKMGGDHKMMMDTMMMGLSASEKKTAMHHMAKMSSAEKAVMHKRCMMCMKDKHAAMDMSAMTEKMRMDHMMSGLSKSEQKTMMRMMSKMSPKEKMVGEKMMANCCMYGMNHGK